MDDKFAYPHQTCPRCGSDEWIMDNGPDDTVSCHRPLDDDRICGAVWNPWT